jgi:hypothetical protein
MNMELQSIPVGVNAPKLDSTMQRLNLLEFNINSIHDTMVTNCVSIASNKY